MGNNTSSAEEKFWQEKRDREEAAENKRREAESRQQSQSMAMSVLSWFGDNWFSALIIGGIGFWLFATESGKKAWDGIKDFAGKMFDKLPEGDIKSWVQSLLGMDMHKALSEKANDLPALHKQLTEDAKIPEGIVKIIAPTKEAFDNFLNLVSDANSERDANGKVTKKGAVNKDTMVNANTLFELIKRDPDKAQKLAVEVMKPGNADANKEMNEKVFGSFRAIVADEARLRTLFTDHRSATERLLNIVAGAGKEAQVKELFEIYKGKEGPKVVADLLTKFLTPGADGKLPDPKMVFKQVSDSSPEAQKVLEPAAQRMAENAPEVKAFIATLTATPEGQRLVDKLGLAGVARLAMVGDLPADQKAAAAIKLLLAPENLAALPDALLVAAKNDDIKKLLPFDVAALGTLVQTGMKDGNPTKAFQPVLAALAAQAEAGNTISLAPLQKPLMAFALSPESASNAKEMVPALQTLAKGIDPSTLSAEQRGQLAFVVDKLTPAMLPILSKMNATDVDPLLVLAKFAPANGEKLTMAQTFTVLLDPDTRAALQTMDPTNTNTVALAKELGVTSAYVTPKNFGAVVKFAADMQSNPENGANAAAEKRANKVLRAFTKLMDNVENLDAFATAAAAVAKDITPEELSGFFKSSRSKNSEAFQAFLNNIDINSLPKDSQPVLTAVRKEFGYGQEKGLAAVLSDDKGGAAFVLKKMQEPDTQKGWFASLPVTQFLSLSLEKGRVPNNIKSILTVGLTVGEALQQAGVGVQPNKPLEDRTHETTRAGTTPRVNPYLKPVAATASTPR